MVHAFDGQPAFEYATVANNDFSYLEGGVEDCDPSESTYHSSDFKPTPVLGEAVIEHKPKQIGENPTTTGYLLRSSVHPNVIRSDAEFMD